ncbi:ArnT family glycosyltransferase [Lewinella sp. IMCC34191]|uniref:ArnT family glycosyltransferase n=1 Tax=Lewinella sp. IMCC34191 TaxID=2259172 RepID=UPI000E257C09|nr:glycosyltransferase family 39 protein [Lewinella sp. IMCC34191]
MHLKYLYLAGLIVSFAVSFVMHVDVFPREIIGMHDWRQTQTMWNVRNFERYDNDIRSPRVSSLNGAKKNLLRLEFPIMQWGIAQVVRLTGQDVLTARVCVWLIGIAGLVGFFGLLRTMGFSPGIALAGTVLLEFSPLFYFYTVNVIPDMFALSAGIWFLFFSFRYFRDRRWWQLLASAIALMLSSLAKLPFAMLGIIGIVFVVAEIIRHRRITRDAVAYPLTHLVFFSATINWYATVMPTWGSSPALYGIFGSTNTHQENMRILYHWMEQYIPYDLSSRPIWPFFILGALVPVGNRLVRVNYGKYVWSLAFITLLFVILQWNTITFVHDYYLLPLLPWLYIVVTAGLERVWRWCLLLPRWKYALALPLLISPVVAAPVFASELRDPRWEGYYGSFNGQVMDAYKYQRELQAITGPDEKVIVLNDNSMQIITWLIRKRGYVFGNDALEPGWIADVVDNDDVSYLYSNTRTFEQRPDIAPLLDSLVASYGNINVYYVGKTE